MKPVAIAVICFALGASLNPLTSTAKDVAEQLGEMFKSPSKDDLRAEMQPSMDQMDEDQLQGLAVDYAYREKVLRLEIEGHKDTNEKAISKVFELRAALKKCEAL